MFFYQISTLTAEVDVINSTTNTTEKPTLDARPGDGNDVFIAGGATPTLNPGDTLDGMGGLNTLKIYGAEAGLGSFSAASIKNIQTVELHAAGTNKNLDVSGNADVKTVIGVDALSADTQTMTATLAQTVGFKGAMAKAQTVTFKDVTGSADKATIMLDGASAATGLTVTTGVEDLTFATAGKNDVNALTVGTVKSLSVTGTGSFDATLATTTNKLATVLSTTSGDVTLDLSTSGVLATTGKYSITTGAGNDNITIASADLVKDAKINLGDGAKDTLTIVNASAYGMPTDALSNVTGVETLGFKTATKVTLDAGKVGSIDDFVFTANHATDGAFAVTNAIDGTTITLNGANLSGTNNAFAASSVGVPTGGSGNSLNLILNGGAAAKDQVTLVADTGLTVEQTKVNITSTHVADSALTDANALKLTVTNGSNIKIDGGHDLTLTTTAGINLAIVAADFTGKLAVTGSTGADDIKGGHGDDTITTGGGLDTLWGGEGKDTFVFSGTVAGTAANQITVGDFVSGSDHINISGTSVSTGTGAVGALKTLSDAGTLAEALNVLATGGNGTNGQVNWGVYKGSTYIVVDNTSGNTLTATDAVIKLAGITNLVADDISVA